VYVNLRPSPKVLLMDALVELNESVEFKSLPSGLHNVQEDIMYDYWPIGTAYMSLICA